MTYTTFNPYDSNLDLPIMETACPHKHRSIRTAEKCSIKRNPTRAAGTPIIDIFHSDGSPLTGAEWYERMMDALL